MGSSRLPGKVLQDVSGASMLARVIERLRAADTIDEVVVATSTEPEDDDVVAEATRLEAGTYRGSVSDVLDRFARAAVAARGDIVVRATADCPLLDPSVIDRVVSALGPEVDYASNTHARSYPRGLDIEALHADTLARIARLAGSPAAREHVTSFIMEEPSLFRVRQVVAEQNDADLRWTVDTHDDLALVRALYALFDLDRGIRPYRDLVDAMRARPELVSVNAHVIQRGWRSSWRRA